MSEKQYDGKKNTRNSWLTQWSTIGLLIEHNYMEPYYQNLLQTVLKVY